MVKAQGAIGYAFQGFENKTECGSYLSGEKQYGFVVKVFTKSSSLGKLSNSHLWQKDLFVSSCYHLHISSIARFELFIWLSDVPASSQASPTSRHHTGICKHSSQGRPVWRRVRPDQPLSPLGSLLEDDEVAVLPVLPQSCFPRPLCVELSSTVGAGEPTSRTAEVEEVYLFFRFVHLQWNVFNEKIKKMCV